MFVVTQLAPFVHCLATRQAWNLSSLPDAVSFYRKEKICDMLGLDWGQFEIARDRLISMKLVAFEPYSAMTPNGHYQVLPVDGRPPNFTGAIFGS